MYKQPYNYKSEIQDKSYSENSKAQDSEQDN